MGVNNLPRVAAQQCTRRESNPQPFDHKSNALPLHYRVTLLKADTLKHIFLIKCQCYKYDGICYDVDRVKTKASRGSKADKDKDAAKDDGYYVRSVNCTLTPFFVLPATALWCLYRLRKAAHDKHLVLSQFLNFLVS